MRTGLPAAFVTELTRQGRKPRQLLEFYFAAATVYVSDQEYGDALANNYLPLVESWGRLEDTSDLQAVIDGTAGGTKQLSLTLINKRVAPFSALFTDEPPENVRVKLYQWFEGTDEADKVLVDEFIVQDPIDFDEASNLLHLDLVSLNQYADPYIGQLSAADNNFYGIVIGAISNSPGTPYGSRPIVQLAADLSATATTITCTSSPATAGFAASGQIRIDYESINYTGISGNSFTGCTRGVFPGVEDTTDWSSPMPHASGQYVFQGKHEYLYSFGQGPLEVMGPVYLDGVEYAGKYTVHADRNPAQVGFWNCDPFVRAIASTTVTKNVDTFKLGNRGNGSSLDNITWYNTNDAAIRADDGVYCYCRGRQAEWYENTLLAWQYADVQFPISSGISAYADLVSAKIIADVHQMGHGGSFPVMMDGFQVRRSYRTDGGWDRATAKTESSAGGDVTFELDMTSFGWYATNVGYTTQLVSICLSRLSQDAFRVFCQLDLVRLEVKYKPYVKVHSTTVTCDLYSGTGNTNPADAIKMVLSRVGIASAIDATSFATAKSWFTANSYQFNGWLAGDLRCREVLAAMCQQSRSRLAYSGGKIKLLVREHVSDKTVDQSFTGISIRAKSIAVARQPIKDILNKITVRYQPTALDTYNEVIVKSDTDSVARYGLHEAVWDFFLVEATAMATDLANFYLAELATPVTYLTFQAYIGAFALEMDDTLAVYTEFGNFTMFKGDVGRVAREFGSAKENSINLYTVTVIGRPVPAITLDLEDNAAPADSFEDVGLMLNIDDTATPADELETGQETTDQNGYGQGGYGQGGYGD